MRKLFPFVVFLVLVSVVWLGAGCGTTEPQEGTVLEGSENGGSTTEGMTQEQLVQLIQQTVSDMNLKGEKGDTGAQGPKGDPGKLALPDAYSVTIKYRYNQSSNVSMSTVGLDSTPSTTYACTSSGPSSAWLQLEAGDLILCDTPTDGGGLGIGVSVQGPWNMDIGSGATIGTYFETKDHSGNWCSIVFCLITPAKGYYRFNILSDSSGTPYTFNAEGRQGWDLTLRIYQLGQFWNQSTTLS